MLLKQYYLSCLSHASYMIADESTGHAAVVDPQRDIDQYLADAQARNLSIRWVMLTHFHADFVAGHIELRERAGAEICLGANARAEYDFQAMANGAEIGFGAVRIRALATPGHTPEGVSYLVFDTNQSRERPNAVLTGDTLFIGGIGRPDLMASVGVTAEALASQLYDSLHGTLLALPAETLVYPAHGAGSLCGAQLSKDTVSTIGRERATNPSLRAMSREAFIAMATSDLPESPRYFGFDAALNKRERMPLERTLDTLQPLAVEDLLRLMNSGVQIVDVRPSSEFAQHHLRGSLSVGLDGKVETWAGSTLDMERAIAIIAAPGDEREAATRLGRIGFDDVRGYLEGGVAALEPYPEQVSTFRRLDAHALAKQLEQRPAPMVLDVRNVGEYRSGHMPGALNIPLGRLTEDFKQIPRDRELIVHCAGGYRSVVAMSMLERAGFGAITDLKGGFAAWQREGLPVES